MKILFVETLAFGIGALICFIGGFLEKPSTIVLFLPAGLILSGSCLFGYRLLCIGFKLCEPRDNIPYSLIDFLRDN